MLPRTTPSQTTQRKNPFPTTTLRSPSLTKSMTTVYPNAAYGLPCQCPHWFWLGTPSVLRHWRHPASHLGSPHQCLHWFCLKLALLTPHPVLPHLQLWLSLPVPRPPFSLPCIRINLTLPMQPPAQPCPASVHTWTASSLACHCLWRLHWLGDWLSIVLTVSRKPLDLLQL